MQTLLLVLLMKEKTLVGWMKTPIRHHVVHLNLILRVPSISSMALPVELLENMLR